MASPLHTEDMPEKLPVMATAFNQHKVMMAISLRESSSGPTICPPTFHVKFTVRVGVALHVFIVYNLYCEPLVNFQKAF